MDPQAQFCHNPDCPARGQLGLGNIRVHSRTERRYRCTSCGRTFAATHDTPFYRLKKPTELVIIVLTSALPWLSAASDRRRLRPRRADRRRLAGSGGPARAALP